MQFFCINFEVVLILVIGCPLIFDNGGKKWRKKVAYCTTRCAFDEKVTCKNQDNTIKST